MDRLNLHAHVKKKGHLLIRNCWTVCWLIQWHFFKKCITIYLKILLIFQERKIVWCSLNCFFNLYFFYLNTWGIFSGVSAYEKIRHHSGRLRVWMVGCVCVHCNCLVNGVLPPEDDWDGSSTPATLMRLSGSDMDGCIPFQKKNVIRLRVHLWKNVNYFTALHF